jgi:hypothetical protein
VPVAKRSGKALTTELESNSTKHNSLFYMRLLNTGLMKTTRQAILTGGSMSGNFLTP